MGICDSLRGSCPCRLKLCRSKSYWPFLIKLIYITSLRSMWRLGKNDFFFYFERKGVFWSFFHWKSKYLREKMVDIFNICRIKLELLRIDIQMLHSHLFIAFYRTLISWKLTKLLAFKIVTWKKSVALVWHCATV